MTDTFATNQPLLAAAAPSRVDPPATDGSRPKRGGIVRRLAAAAVDVSASFGAAYAIGGIVAILVGGAADPTASESLAVLLLGAFAWHYHVRQPVLRGGTPGMRLLGLRIADVDSFAPISTRQAAVRFVLCALLTWPAALGLLTAAFDRRHRAWHDRIAKTVVVAR